MPRVLLALTLLALFAAPATAAAAARKAGAAQQSPFSASSLWGARLAADAPADPRSRLLVGDLVRQVARYGPWVNTTRYSAPVYEVPRSQPRVRVELDAPDTRLQDAFAAVPIPPGARPSRGTDRSLVVWQRSTDTVWELWRARRVGGTWRATWGGRMLDASRSDGAYPWPYGVAASGLSLLGGLIRPEEIRRGRIDHALAMSVPEVTRTVVRAPATRTDGTAARGIPMGTRFRLDPSVDVRSLRLPWAAALIAKAAQDHGIVVTDRGGSVTFYAEDPASIGFNPWPRLFEHRYPSRMLSAFPWERLEVVRP